jgi:cell division septal protein FtsQ
MRKAKYIILFVLVIIFTFSGIVLSGLWKDRSTVKKIVVSGNVTLSKEEIFDYAKLNDSLLMTNGLSLDRIESRISKHPNIKKVNAVRDGTTIKIEISEKDPFAVVNNGSSMFLVDDKLNLYNMKKENADLDLPVISGLSNQMNINTIASSDLRNLKIAQYIISSCVKKDKLLYNLISEISFADTSGIVIYTADDVTPVYLVDYDFVPYSGKSPIHENGIDINNTLFRKELDQKLICLRSFLKQVMMYRSRNSFEFVDLRYKDVVVVRNKNFSTIE